ncbi:hypothetical protein BOX15_Mlig018865g1 [Macrostomum lignano]|uniref:Uncharacterized protein n=1 Tax=Macrostomum lignano TaxID=282301 RepID=A0A267G890_9PLAT|nr:hypothetical protein BOX15_Mlig018865g1 [Macrostomum lignano]
MSAASVLPIHHQQQPSAAQSSFSALTLFESTLLNAGMLLDSMTLDELVAAVRLICNLQHQAVDVMQPCAGQVQSSNRELQEQLQQLQQQQQSLRQHHSAAASCSSAAAAAGAGDGASPPSAKRPCKLEPKEPLLGVKLEQQHQQLHQQTLGHVDSFASDAGGASSFPGDDEDDDCLLLEEESSFSGGAGACAAGGPSNVDVRNLLKDTYKNLRGSGPHLFDFAKPFEHPMNQMVAKKVIDQAQAVSGIAANAEVWRSAINRYFVTQGVTMAKHRISAKRPNDGKQS